MKSLARNAIGNAITSFSKELNPSGVGEYIYIYIYIYIYCDNYSTNLITYKSSNICIYLYINLSYV